MVVNNDAEQECVDDKFAHKKDGQCLYDFYSIVYVMP